MTGLMLAVLLAALDQTIVGTAEPRIIAQLSGFDRYPWVSTTYLLTSTLAVPIFAKLSDMYGRKWFFLGGSVMFVLTSALCGAAGTLNFLRHRRHEPAHRFSRAAGHRRGHDDGPGVHHHRRRFLARRARQVSGLFRGRLGTCFHLRPDPRRLAHRSHLLARGVLREPAGGPGRDRRHLLSIPGTASGRRANAAWIGRA